jgi:acetylornithine/succinyldiaminopimelate/putrescine aminotransferase
MAKAKAICKKYNVLLIADEVQVMTAAQIGGCIFDD